MTPFVFAGNVSAPVSLNGNVKIIAAGLQPNTTMTIQEEQPDGSYAAAPLSWAIFNKEDYSKILFLIGNYRAVRSSNDITVGYEAE